MAAAEYTIGLTVDGVDVVASAADKVDDLDASLRGADVAADRAAAGFDTAAKDAKRLAREFDSADKKTLELADHYGDLSSIMNTFEGPIGRIGGRVFELREAFMKLSLFTSRGTAIFAAASVGLVALAAVAVMAAAAVLALGAAFVGLAIKTASAANKTNHIREAWTGSAAKAAALTATIARMSKTLPVSSAKLGELADGLYKAGKRGADLEKELRKAALAEAGLPDGAGAKIIAKRMTDIDVIGSRLSSNLQDIFAGAKTRKATGEFGSALSGFTERFGENKAEGKALQTLLGTISAPLIGALKALMPLAVSTFRAMIILTLDVAIAAAKAALAIKKIIPDEAKDAIKDFTSSEDAMTAATWALIAVIAVVTVVLAVLTGILVVLGAIILGVVVAAVLIVVAPFVLFAAILAAVIVAIYATISAIVDIVSELGGLASAGATTAGNMIDGLVAGIRSGVGVVADAMRALASSAIGALKSALKIASPSKVFEQLGAFTGEGFTVGVEAETSDVQNALETMTASPMVDAPSAGRRPAGAGSFGGGEGASGASVDLAGATFNFFGVEGAEGAVSRFADALTSVIEGDAIAMGAA